MTDWLQDVKTATRQLRARPGFTALTVLTLAAGMGVNAVAFTVVNGLFLRGFAAHAEPGVRRVLTTPASDEGGLASLDELARFTDGVRGSALLAAEGRLTLAWRHEGITETAWALAVSSQYFSMVSPRVVAGQLRVGRGPGDVPQVVLGQRFWRDKLGARSLAGLTVRFNEVDVDVAGVLDEAFTGPGGAYSPDVWVPLENLATFHVSPALNRRDLRWLFVLARADAGSDAAAVQGRLDAAAAAMAAEWPETHRDRGARLQDLGAAAGDVRGHAAAAVMGIIGVILLLACFNVTNLLLARAVEREREVGIRTALGASPGRLMRLVLTEGLLIALMAGMAALAVASWTETLVSVFAPPIDEPQRVDLSPDASVVLFMAGLVVLASVAPGLWPALAAARVSVIRALGAHGGLTCGRPAALRQWLVGAQVAGATAFLVVAALFVQSFGYLSTARMGFAQEELLVTEFEPASHGYSLDRTRRYVEELTERTRALPGVSRVAITDRAPFFIGFDRMTSVWTGATPCEPVTCPTFPTFAVGPGYFGTMGIAVETGREFVTEESPAAEAIVNGLLARRLWPGEEAVGKTLRLGPDGAVVTVVGIAASSKTRGLDGAVPTLYLPLGADSRAGPLTMVIRTATPALLSRPLREAAQAMDSRIALQVRTMEQRMAVQLWPYRTLGWVFSICAGLAVLLAMTGLAGVVAHAVSRRMREFGVRMALGATSRDVAAEVVRSGIRLLVPGLASGLLLAGASSRLLRAAFVGVNVLDVRVYLGVAAVQAALVLVACLAPAIRSSRAAPVAILRSE